jgi:hypothetical protein
MCRAGSSPSPCRHRARSQRRPVRTRTRRIRTTRPNPPLGTYPQLRLCDQVGSAPTSASTTTMSRIVPMAAFVRPVADLVASRPTPSLSRPCTAPCPLFRTRRVPGECANPDPLPSWSSPTRSPSCGIGWLVGCCGGLSPQVPARSAQNLGATPTGRRGRYRSARGPAGSVRDSRPAPCPDATLTLRPPAAPARHTRWGPPFVLSDDRQAGCARLPLREARGFRRRIPRWPVR